MSVAEQLLAVCSDYETQKRRTRTALARHVPGLIRSLLRDNMTYRQIAIYCGVSGKYISQIMNEQQQPSPAVGAELTRLATERMRHES